jgi:cell fate (sporulation/competence/biofilm development) regulator YmcA (YheA/YmcA/DUF963 family)
LVWGVTEATFAYYEDRVKLLPLMACCQDKYEDLNNIYRYLSWRVESNVQSKLIGTQL